MNYNNGKIYKIVGGDECYIGATTKEHLCQRIAGHRSDYQKWKNAKRTFITSFYLFEKYGIENCTIELIELFPCISKDELNAREGYYIRNITCVNKNIPNRTNAEYRVDNQEKIKQYRAEHHEEINKKYTCDCGGKFTHKHKQRHLKSAKHQQFISL